MTPARPGAVAPETTAPARPRRRWGRAAQIAGTTAVAVGASWAIYRERATVAGGLRVLGEHTGLGWVAACIAVQCLSMVFFALLQQRLLTAGGARLTAPWLLSTLYLANAIAVAVPVIGSGMAATYRFFPATFTRRQAHERLGIVADEVPGCHCVALSHPTELSDLLVSYLG
jgi:hypothetical protein